jgi:hypothetical protein
MKTFLTIAVVLVFAITGIFAANVTFNLTDFLGTVETIKRSTALIEPRSAPRSSITNVVLKESRFFNTGTNGIFTATNMVDGLYRVTVKGINFTSVFHVNIPSTNGTLQASDYLTTLSTGALETEEGQPLDLE